MIKVISLFLALFGLMTPFTAEGRALNLITFTVVAAGIFWRKSGEKLAIVVLCLLALQLLITGALEGKQIIGQLSTPLGAIYTTDMRAFLKTYQLMKNGGDFYNSFATGMGGLRANVFHGDINAWRQPLLFYIWKALPGYGIGIYFFWEAVVIGVLLFSYLIARKFLPLGLAIISPFILLPYFHFSLVDLTILQPEWWAVSCVIFGLGFYLYKKYFLMGIFLALSLAIRELTIIPVAAILLIVITRNKKHLLKIAGPIGVFAAYYVFCHLPHIFHFQTEWLRSARNGNLSAIHSLFAYSSWSYLLGQFRPFLVLLSLSLISFIKNRRIILLATFLPFFLFALLIAAAGGIDQTRDYWGIYFVPLLLISAPILILPPDE